MDSEDNDDYKDNGKEDNGGKVRFSKSTCNVVGHELGENTIINRIAQTDLRADSAGRLDERGHKRLNPPRFRSSTWILGYSRDEPQLSHQWRDHLP